MIAFRLPADTIAAIKSKAEAAGVSQAKLITLAVAAYEPPASP